MDRINEVAKLVNGLRINTLLDVGCRDCALKDKLDLDIGYSGCDLFQNSDNSVKYVGDINEIDIGESFDCVSAIDILEHVDDPYFLFEKLLRMTDRYLVVSLPNIYDLKSKFHFVVKDSLGGKYSFGVSNSLDRHRWIMSYEEINRFYLHKKKEGCLDLKVVDIRYGEMNASLTSLGGYFLRFLLPTRYTTSSVVALFSKRGQSPS